MAWTEIWSTTRRSFLTPEFSSAFCRFYSSSTPYVVKVGIPEFLNGVGKGVEAHTGKLEGEIGDFQKLLVTRTLKLKKLGIPCKHEVDTEVRSQIQARTMEAPSRARKA